MVAGPSPPAPCGKATRAVADFPASPADMAGMWLTGGGVAAGRYNVARDDIAAAVRALPQNRERSMTDPSLGAYNIFDRRLLETGTVARG